MADALQQNEGRDMHKYAEYMRNQVTELLTNYGKIDILWFDFSYDGQDGEGDQSWMKGKGKNDWEAEKLIATAVPFSRTLSLTTVPTSNRICGRLSSISRSNGLPILKQANW